MNFLEWLAHKHPDVHLTLMQRAWAKAAIYYVETGVDPPQWHGGMRSGKTFMYNLWKEYIDEQDADR